MHQTYLTEHNLHPPFGLYHFQHSQVQERTLYGQTEQARSENGLWAMARREKKLRTPNVSFFAAHIVRPVAWQRLPHSLIWLIKY